MADWNETTAETALNMVKTDLGILTSTLYDDRLAQYIEAARAEIVREGVNDLSDSVADVQLVSGLAGWLWRKRDTGEPLPQFLRFQINNRIFSTKAKTEG